MTPKKKTKKVKYGLVLGLPAQAGVVAICVIITTLILKNFLPIQKDKSAMSLFDKFIPKSKNECLYEDNFEYYYYKPTNKLLQKNNKFGIYIYAENKDFFKLAQELVNSNGGDWGYVLIPYNVRDRDYEKWKTVFEQVNERHLIPIIQLWDVNTKDYKDQTKKSAEFLDSFLWPIKNRYISVYNEPNDEKFWGGKVDPENYAKVLDYTIKTFKKENSNFFMLNGGFNVSAETNSQYLDSLSFMYLMNQAVKGIFDELDGWASHSYPQPNFSGGVYSTGRWSIKAYNEELRYLKDTLGVKKDLPVFITETGWAHAEGENWNSSYFASDIVSQNYKEAFENVWLLDPKVVAVMPFTIRYDAPFDHFSWVNSDNVGYKQYEVVKSIKKEAGTPDLVSKGNVSSFVCTKQLKK